MNKTRWLATVGAVAVAAGSLLTLGSTASSAQPFGLQSLNSVQKRHVSGMLSSELDVSNAARQRGAAPVRSTPRVPQQPGPSGCTATRGSNRKVNANCLNLTDADLSGRGQAQNETWIAVDPNDSSRIVASYNDYRRGDGTCGVSYSSNAGRTWADSTTPNGFVRGD